MATCWRASALRRSGRFITIRILDEQDSGEFQELLQGFCMFLCILDVSENGIQVLNGKQ